MSRISWQMCDIFEIRNCIHDTMHVFSYMASHWLFSMLIQWAVPSDPSPQSTSLSGMESNPQVIASNTQTSNSIVTFYKPLLTFPFKKFFCPLSLHTIIPLWLKPLINPSLIIHPQKSLPPLPRGISLCTDLSKTWSHKLVKPSLTVSQVSKIHCMTVHSCCCGSSPYGSSQQSWILQGRKGDLQGDGSRNPHMYRLWT